MNEWRLCANTSTNLEPFPDSEVRVIDVEQKVEEPNDTYGSHGSLRSLAPPSLTRGVPELPRDLRGDQTVFSSPSTTITRAEAALA